MLGKSEWFIGGRTNHLSAWIAFVRALSRKNVEGTYIPSQGRVPLMSIKHVSNVNSSNHTDYLNKSMIIIDCLKKINAGPEQKPAHPVAHPRFDGWSWTRRFLTLIITIEIHYVVLNSMPLNFSLQMSRGPFPIFPTYDWLLWFEPPTTGLYNSLKHISKSQSPTQPPQPCLERPRGYSINALKTNIDL